MKRVDVKDLVADKFYIVTVDEGRMHYCKCVYRDYDDPKHNCFEFHVKKEGWGFVYFTSPYGVYDIFEG
jgi:hypothetical protein